MAQLDFYIVDVFAEEKYAGNQLAVFIDLEQQLSTTEMLQITREINFAESTFITSINKDGSFSVRIFTTEYEVPFAGHPTLGTSYIIAKELLNEPVSKLVLKLKKGNIPVELDNPKNLNASRFTMQQAQPEFGAFFEPQMVSEALQIPFDDIDTSLPIQDVNTGLPYVIISLKSREAIEKIRLNFDALKQFLITNELHKSNNPRKLSSALFFVTPVTVDAKKDFHTRMFVLDDMTIWEDAATGSANGCFLAYLLKHVAPRQSIVVEQGFEMGRKSILYLDGEKHDDQYNLRVGGQVVPISRGVWAV